MHLHSDYSLRHHNTFGFDVRASRFVEAHDLETLRSALQLRARHQWPLLILGGGSNLVLTDDIPGLTLQPKLCQLEFTDVGDHVVVSAGAGIVWDELVQTCVSRNLWGIENLSLIPGSVGAAPVQNIGAYGVELADCLLGVKYLEVDSGELKTLTREQGNYGYRDSVFKRELQGQAIITQIRLRLSKTPSPALHYQALKEALPAGSDANDISLIRETVIKVRQSKLPDPAITGNAGSFFKNPTITAHHFESLIAQHPSIPGHAQADGSIKTAAGWLVERAGWKGFRQDGVGVHDQQALVLVNTGGGNGKQICHLADRIQADVLQKFGIELEIEPQIRP